MGLKDASTLIKNWLISTVLVAFIILVFIKDSNDDIGDQPYVYQVTDELTGCQYIVIPLTGVIPRVNDKNEHICNINKD